MLFSKGADFEVLSIATELADTRPVGIAHAVAFMDGHMDHPAWKALAAAPLATRRAIRVAFLADIDAIAADGQMSDHTTLNVAFARRAP